MSLWYPSLGQPLQPVAVITTTKRSPSVLLYTFYLVNHWILSAVRVAGTPPFAGSVFLTELVINPVKTSTWWWVDA